MSFSTLRVVFLATAVAISILLFLYLLVVRVDVTHHLGEHLRSNPVQSEGRLVMLSAAAVVTATGLLEVVRQQRLEVVAPLGEHHLQARVRRKRIKKKNKRVRC